MNMNRIKMWLALSWFWLAGVARTWRSKLAWWPVRDARMAWPFTGQGSLAVGVVVTGVTTIRWGSKQTVTSINATAVNGTTVGIVDDIQEEAIVDPTLLPNGDGPSITRVQVVDGVKWTVTIRDDTGITNRPKIGTDVLIVDMAGFLGAVALIYHATVCEASYRTAPKKEGTFNLTVENRVLIESQTGA